MTDVSSHPEESEEDPLVRVSGLTKHFDNSSGLLGSYEFAPDGLSFPFTHNPETVRAVDGVSFEIEQGETLGLVGESGCGKSTLARVLLQLLSPTDGDIHFQGENLAELSNEALRQRREDIQMIFQDPQSSLDPRMKIGAIIEEPMEAHGLRDATGREQRAKELLESVGLEPQYYDRYPHEFSGGQRQRINLARALSVDPDFVVLDEPTSALDVSIQAQILNTLQDLQTEFGLTYLFISHDLSVIRHISDRVAVMYLGELVEVGDVDRLFEDPRHPYTQALLSSIPVPDPRSRGERSVLHGDVPSPINPPSGCRFRTRCPALIVPAEYDISDSEWADVRELIRAVDRRSFDADSVSHIQEQFLDGRLTDTRCQEVVTEAIEHTVADEWERATELLQTEFAEKSVCAETAPSLDSITGEPTTDRRVACHLHGSEGEPIQHE
ncbi:oligopeptide/dipeptide ABC transporter, ATP-binding protein, C-terminal domain-containing protein [Halobellus clavatus]|uniref:Oligopeptide/dipeptide ABC transporter, ATP-binding protein, C-terminal domain-containing protein n=1 Tax=Halobellus clavatus TaxID=660517 RepID=A0A1H3I6K4_9EURY|nr:oligopeptide/dipeptide ABC transporter ATP-binding protein [Halobellus clavatus]SDY23307.1 oligopeptide/dipeptide ABC transporter, ATP-binding protein, C-terminal domain-containing protein [Halobellus clavatus]